MQEQNQHPNINWDLFHSVMSWCLKRASPLLISAFTFLILGPHALCCYMFQLYPVQENVWYLYQLHCRRSKQQSAKDNTSPGINKLQGNGPGPAGSCFKTLKRGEVPHVKNRKCGPVESASLHTVSIPALQLPVREFHSNLPTSCVWGHSSRDHRDLIYMKLLKLFLDFIIPSC